MSLSSFSDAFADAVEAVTPSLLGVPRRRALATLTAVDAHHLMGSAKLARHAPKEALLPNGETLEVRFVAASRGLDVAVFETEAELTPVRWSETVRVGNLVLPVAYGPRATLGVVARVGGPWVTPSGHQVDRYLHVDGSLPLGFAGGPLLGPGGALGINVRGLVRGGTTIPARTVQNALEALLKHGNAEPGFLGIGGASATLTDAQAKVAGQAEALLVVAVEPGTPADGVLTVGDIVLALAGSPIDSVPGLRAALTSHAAGSEVTLKVLSGGTVEERQVTLGERSSCR